jgi:hypothetical protein
MKNEKHNIQTELRLEKIMDDMRGLRFVRGKTYKEYAKAWGLSEDRVRKLTAEASRRVYAEVTDPERVKPDLCALLMRSANEAYAAKRYNDVAQLCRVYGDMLGFRAPAQAKVTIEPGERTPQQARQIMAELFGAAALPAEKKEVAA